MPESSRPLSLLDIADIFLRPAAVFRRLADDSAGFKRILFGYALWLGLIPPVCAWFGTSAFGWRLGIGEAVQISPERSAIVFPLYYLCLLAGFGFATGLARWMAPTYGATPSAGRCASLVAVVGTPLMVGGLLHLYPLLPLNLLCLIPAVVWSVYLLYTGLPVVMGTDSVRGMLMASSLLAGFFVAAIGLAGLTMMLWALGLGPDLGFSWRLSVG